MGKIWAIAVNTFRQALRMKIALVFILLLLFMLPVMGLTASGDGTLKGRLQTFVSYGLSLTTILMSILTVVVSVYTLSSDIEHKQLFTVLTKPVRRFELLIGKFTGIVIFDLLLMLVFGLIIYLVAVYLPDLTDAPADQRAAAHREFYTARESRFPPAPDVSEAVLQAFQRLKNMNQVPPGVEANLHEREAFLDEIAAQLKLRERAVAPGREITWEFSNIKPAEGNKTIFIRFKYDVSINPPDMQVYSNWRIGDNRKGPDEVSTPLYFTERKDTIRTFHEIEIPAEAIAEDGYLAVSFRNIAGANNTVVLFPLEDGLEVMYKADIFTRNYLRGCMLIFFRLVFLSVLGLMAAAFLSMPVAVLFSIAVLLIAHISNFGLESFESLTQGFGTIYQYTFVPLVKIMPQFDRFSPVDKLVSARLIPWSFVWRGAFLMIFIKSTLMLLIAVWIFGRREIARVTV